MSTLEGQLLKSYDLGTVQLIIGGIPIGGYGEDGGLEYEQSSALFEFNVGATGLVTASRLNDDLVFAIITVMETSASYRNLGRIMQAQAALPGVIVPLAYLMFDPLTGDTIASAFVVFDTRPNMTKGRTAGERVFRVALPGAGANAVFGALNLI